MEFFAKIKFNFIKFNLLTISAKTYILNVWQSCEYASEMFHKSFQILYNSCFFFMWKAMFTVTHFYMFYLIKPQMCLNISQKEVFKAPVIKVKDHWWNEDIAFLACSLFWNWMFYRSAKNAQKTPVFVPNFSNEFRPSHKSKPILTDVYPIL